VSSTNTESAVTWTANKHVTGKGIYLDVVGRHVSAHKEYRGRVHVLPNGSVAISLLRFRNSSTAQVVASKASLRAITYRPGMKLRTRLQVIGVRPTTLRLKVWPANQAEPSAWQLTATDSSPALQSAGSVGLVTSLHETSHAAPVTVSVSSYSVQSKVAPPTARFTTRTGTSGVTVDGTASTDPNGTIRSYTWSWGDGVITHGVRSTHTYAKAGTYRITLTVIDHSGWRSVTTHTVTIMP
jgi:hypothetical protein